MAEDSKTLARKLYEEAWSQGKLEIVDKALSAECRLHDSAFPGMPPGSEGYKRYISACRSAFPDLRCNVDDVITERNEVVVRWTSKGTHRGQFLNHPPTNKTATIPGTTIFRFDGPKIVEIWTDWNALSVLEQLGLVAAQKYQSA